MKRRGFGSIFEFAFKLSGVSEEQVRRVLNLEKRFTDTPLLKAMLEKGAVSINKLARVASVATSENEEFLATQVRILPQSALETFVRDIKTEIATGDVNWPEIQNGLFKPNFDEKSVRAHMPPKQNNNMTNSENGLRLSGKVVQALLELQQKGIDVNKLILGFLEKRELEIAQEKEKLVSEMKEKGQTDSRYIPVKVREIIKKEYGEKCSIPHCSREAETIHHTQRFSLAKTHDPRFLAPLCKEHHQIAHGIDVKYQEARMVSRAAPSRNLDSE